MYPINPSQNPYGHHPSEQNLYRAQAHGAPPRPRPASFAPSEPEASGQSSISLYNPTSFLPHNAAPTIQANAIIPTPLNIIHQAPPPSALSTLLPFNPPLPSSHSLANPAPLVLAEVGSGMGSGMAYIDPQKANNVVLRCERPYMDRRRFGTIDGVGNGISREGLEVGVGLGMGADIGPVGPEREIVGGEMTVRGQGHAGWISPFESWQNPNSTNNLFHNPAAITPGMVMNGAPPVSLPMHQPIRPLVAKPKLSIQTATPILQPYRTGSKTLPPRQHLAIPLSSSEAAVSPISPMLGSGQSYGDMTGIPAVEGDYLSPQGFGYGSMSSMSMSSPEEMTMQSAISPSTLSSHSFGHPQLVQPLMTTNQLQLPNLNGILKPMNISSPSASFSTGTSALGEEYPDSDMNIDTDMDITLEGESPLDTPLRRISIHEQIPSPMKTLSGNRLTIPVGITDPKKYGMEQLGVGAMQVPVPVVIRPLGAGTHDSAARSKLGKIRGNGGGQALVVGQQDAITRSGLPINPFDQPINAPVNVQFAQLAGSPPSQQRSAPTSGHANNSSSASSQQTAPTGAGDGSAAPVSSGNGTGLGGGKGKKKKGGDEEDDGSGKKKRKKTGKACLQCQKSHLTCDDGRPCGSCVKRGVGDACEEGQRKKARYMMNPEEVVAMKIAKEKRRSVAAQARSQASMDTSTSGLMAFASNMPGESIAESAIPSMDQSQAGLSGTNQDYQGYTEPVEGQDIVPSMTPFADFGNGLGDLGQNWGADFNLNFDQGFQFGSEAANLEYAVLNSIFNENGTPSDLAGQFWPGQGPPNGPPGQVDQPSMNTTTALEQGNPSNMMDFGMHNGNNGWDAALTSMQQSDPIPMALSAGGPGSEHLTALSLPPSSVYDLVSEPHDYVQGYHALMRYLAKNFNQTDILKIVKSLAAFRPSIVALLMPLTREDEVFLEKSFQRTLIELDKLISYSGTPTAVWRRTGEICLVGDEFCKLTGLSRAEMLGMGGGQRKCIYEILDGHSTIEYFAKFSQHAFENTAQNFTMEIVLEVDKPQDGSSGGRKIRCVGSMTIRRDVFDLPSAVIGQLLPI